MTRILFLAPDAMRATPKIEDATVIRCSTLAGVYAALQGGPFEYLCYDRGPLVRVQEPAHD